MTLLLAFYLLSAVATVVQHALLLWASGPEDWWFHARETDGWVWAALAGMITALGVAMASYLRVVCWRNQHQLAAIADRPGQDKYSLRQETVILPRLTMGLALAVTLHNAVAFDTFLQVGRGIFRYSQPLSPWTEERRAADIEEVRVYISGARNGAEKRSLAIRMKSGEEIDMSALVQEADIILVIDTLSGGAGHGLPLRYVRQSQTK